MEPDAAVHPGQPGAQSAVHGAAADAAVTALYQAHALDVARAVAGGPGGYHGLFVDANAISAGSAGQVRVITEQAGASYAAGSRASVASVSQPSWW